MKKYGLLLLMVLAMSTPAWAGPFACVTVDRCVPACAPVTINVRACIPYNCVPAGMSYCIRGGLIIVDLDYDCENCMCGGATCVDEDVVIDSGVCPGMYIVLVRVNAACPGPCCFRPRICAMGSAFFGAHCSDDSQGPPPQDP